MLIDPLTFSFQPQPKQRCGSRVRPPKDRGKAGTRQENGMSRQGLRAPSPESLFTAFHLAPEQMHVRLTRSETRSRIGRTNAGTAKVRTSCPRRARGMAPCRSSTTSKRRTLSSGRTMPWVEWTATRSICTGSSWRRRRTSWRRG